GGPGGGGAPLPRRGGAAGGRGGGRAPPCPPAGPRGRRGSVREAALMPEAPDAAGAPRPQAAAETGVRVARHGLEPMGLTTGAGGTTAPPGTPGEAPVGREGDALGRAAASVPARRRPCPRRRGVAPPRLGLPRGPARGAPRRAAS